jgi:IS605 OrfB family transposase
MGESSVRTVMVPIALDDEQMAALQETIETYSKMWSRVVSWSKNNQSVNRYAAQKAIYQSLREEFPSALSQQVIIALREGCAAVRSWNSNNPKKRWQLRAERKAQSMLMDARLFSLRGNLATLSTRTGAPRIRTLVGDLPEWFAERYPKRRLTAATVHISRSGRPYLNLIHTVPVTQPRTSGKVVGIDRGLYKIAVTSEGGEYTGSQVRAQRRRMAHNRRTLQQKGTRSAKRRLQAMSGREKRYMRNVNHVITTQLAQDESVSTYVLEKLTNIRHRRTSKTMRLWLGQWAFAQFEEFLTYKCQERGIAVTHIDPRYTSQDCNPCGHRDRENRRKGLFLCTACGHRDNADRNAALNIRDRHIISLHAGGAGRSQPPVMDGAPEINPLAGVSGSALTSKPRPSWAG